MDDTACKPAITQKLRSSYTIQTQRATFKDENATHTATTNATPGLKALASKVLKRNTGRNTNATTSEKQRNFERNFTPPNVALYLSGCTINELKEIAGNDWPECEENPARLEAFAKQVSIRKIRQQGIKPSHYTKICNCENCGPIWLWSTAPENVQGCVWCFNRVQGIPIPNPTKNNQP